MTDHRARQTRAAGYVRVSTARQAEEGLSLEAQERRVREYIAAQGWELAAIYVERGVSGRRDDRPELRRLLASLGEIDRLVIPKLDRLGRSNAHLHKLFETLQSAGVELVSIADNIDTSTAAGRLHRNIFASFAEFESDTIGERVRSVTTGRVAAGKHHGRPPYGYVSESGALRPVEPAASVVRRIFADAASGVSQRRIQRALNAEGVPSQTGRDWTQGTVSKLLKNRTYRGAVEINGEEFEGAHDAIVSREVWEAVAKLREATARTTGKGRGRPSSGSHLFTRALQLRCAHCGEAMIPRTDGDTYKCFGREKHGPDSCPMTPVPREAIDSAVFDYFEAVGLDLEGMRDQLRDAAESKAREVVALLRDAERSERDAADAVARIRRDYTSGAISAAEWRELHAEVAAEHEAAQAKLTQLATRAEQVRAAESAAGDAEGEAVRRLAEVKAAIAGEVASGGTLDAVRAALLRLFERFDIARPEVGDVEALPAAERAVVEAQRKEIDRALAEDGVKPLAVGVWEVMPWPREEVVAGVDEAWLPILRREPLALTANNDAVGLPSLSLFPALRATTTTPMREAAYRIASGLKPCVTCARTLPLEAFNADPRRRDGRRGSCGDCERSRARESYAQQSSAQPASSPAGIAQHESSPAHASRPSRTATAAIPSATTGSAHHAPNSAFAPSPTSSPAER